MKIILTGSLGNIGNTTHTKSLSFRKRTFGNSHQRNPAQQTQIEALGAKTQQ
jgi:hypothetical protein